MRRKRPDYAEAVLDYEAKYKAEHGGENGYEPIVAEMLVLIYHRLGVLLVVFSSLLGLLLSILVACI